MSLRDDIQPLLLRHQHIDAMQALADAIEQVAEQHTVTALMKRVEDLEALVHKLAKNDTTVAGILDSHVQINGSVAKALQALQDQINQVKGLL